MKDHPTSFDELPMVLTVKDVAAALNIGYNSAYELVRSDQIKCIRIGKTYRVLKDELRQFLGAPEPSQPPPLPTIGSLRRRHGRKPNT